nr:uncharacterized protein LOC127346962 [Lolium perenne]
MARQLQLCSCGEAAVASGSCGSWIRSCVSGVSACVHVVSGQGVVRIRALSLLKHCNQSDHLRGIQRKSSAVWVARGQNSAVLHCSTLSFCSYEVEEGGLPSGNPNNWYQSLHGLRPWSMAMPCVREARRPWRTCVVAQRLRWRGVARRHGGEAVRAAGEAARAATLLVSGRGMCVSRGRADHRWRTRPAERRTAASITSVRDRVREPGRVGPRAWRHGGARRVSPRSSVAESRRMSSLCLSSCSSSATSFGVCRWRCPACVASGAWRASLRKKMEAAASVRSKAMARGEVAV